MGRAGENDVRPEAQRRYVSLLFADVCDYTILTEAADPEDTELIKRRVEELAADIIHRRGGAISQVYGDGILAVFGLQSPREDDARRAVDAALELHEATGAVRWDGALPYGFEVRLHTGVHAGLVFSRRGDELHGRYELTGDAVNTTARLCGAAGRDEVLVSHAALRGFEAYFATREMAPLSLHGKKLPTPACMVIGRSASRTSFEARSGRGLSAFSGRARELAQIEHVLRDVRDGQLRIALIVGDAGIGKSRLLEELGRVALANSMRVLRGCCDSYGETGPLEPFLQVLRQALELPVGATAEAATVVVDERLARWGGRMQEHRATLLRLLSLLPWPTAPAELQVLIHAVVAALSALIATLSIRAPVLLALDDWQWADDASRQVLASICDDLEPHRVCVLVALREGSDRQTLPKPTLVLKLEPFTMDESRQVVRDLRPVNFDTGLTNALHVRSGGNPLFLEELCRSLPDGPVDGSRVLDHGDVPHTLHGVIQARVAALPAAEVSLLLAASVIGIEFTQALLARVMDTPQLDLQLDALIKQDLIYRTDPPTAFRFKHGITREVIYESVRIAERRRIHGLIAAAIELTASSEHAEALAYHHRQAGNYEHAADYAEQAGDKAMAASSLDRARFQYAAAMLALDRLPADNRTKSRWLAICDKWANPSSYSPARDQLETLQRALDYARELNDRAAEAGASYFIGWFHYVSGDYARCAQAYEHALGLAAETRNHRLTVQLWLTLGQAHAAAGAYDRALPLLVQGIERKHARHPGQKYRAWNLAHALGCKALVHADRGEFVQAASDFDGAFELVGGTGHAMEASLLAHQGMSHCRQGLWQQCAETAGRARATAARTNSSYVFAMSEVFEGHARFVLDASGEALAQIGRAVDWLQARNHGLYISVAHACAAEAQLLAGKLGAARDYAQQALLRAQHGDPLGEAAAYRVLASVHAASGERPEVETCIRSALASGERRDSARERSLTLLLAAELDIVVGGESTLREQAAHSLAEFERMGMPSHAARARRLLGPS